MGLLLSMTCLSGCATQSVKDIDTDPSFPYLDFINNGQDKLVTSAVPSVIPGETSDPFSSLPQGTASSVRPVDFEKTPEVPMPDSTSPTPSETHSDTYSPVTPPPPVNKNPSNEIPSVEVPSSDIPSGDIPSSEIPSRDISSGDIPSSESPSNVDEKVERSLLDFLKIAKVPMGSTAYVWGGGWNKEDTGAGKEAVTLGPSPRWAEFAALQDKDYNFKNTRYQIHDGLDCSGYVGWVLYNTFECENGKKGYVMSSSRMAEHFSRCGFGDYTPAKEVCDWRAGDLMSMKGHVWLVVGMCEDGSVVLMHCSPPGVILSGTKLSDGSNSLAVALAEKYMREYFPQWYEKYPCCERDYSFLSQSSRMRWNRETLSDDEGLSLMTAEEVLALIFEEQQ